ncbi:hypothetical protein Tco_1110916 [Tanacetum coccineum]|uniref:Uncharacterized protein n=1 Tax=Tanacetum coccineum TaxID=301880 RepID=A0ABQ5IK62_9ASTR
MKSKGSIAHDCHNLENTVERLAARRIKKNIWQIVNKLILLATVYYVWNERNKRIVMKEAKTSEELINIIKKHVTDTLLGIKVKSSGALVIWGLNLENGRLECKPLQLLEPYNLEFSLGLLWICVFQDWDLSKLDDLCYQRRMASEIFSLLSEL